VTVAIPLSRAIVGVVDPVVQVADGFGEAARLHLDTIDTETAKLALVVLAYAPPHRAVEASAAARR
jgi:hypothetical protein